jgi:ABC-type transport system substrate-binding protein
LDEKIMKAAEVTDPVERQKMYTEITNIINQEAYYIWVGQPTNYFVLRDWIRVKIDPELNMPDQANPMFYGYYLYTMWKCYEK